MNKQIITTYDQAVDYLYQVPRFTTKNTLEDTRAYLHQLGDPDRQMHIIHVAGTNGKGSTCAYMRSILEAAGKKVAMFTSPHLVDIRERFIIEGKMPGKEEFLRAFLGVYDSLDWKALERGEGFHPTFFEYLFFMAMLLFSDRDLDYCILETGLGGRLDATNSVSCKDLTVITRISLDHVEYLGATVEQIAWEKAGIMMEGVPLVFTGSCAVSDAVFWKRAQELEIGAFEVSKNDYTNLRFKNKIIDFSYESRYYGYVRLTLRTIAAYQAENAALAVRAIEVLDQGREITAAHIQEGLAGAFWAGRMEEVLPEVYVDGAHNEDGIRAFLDTVKNDGLNGRRKLLFSVAADKDYEKMLEELVSSGCFEEIAVAHMHNGRAASLESIEEIMSRYPGCAYTLYEEVGEALHELVAGRRGERIYIAGSLYLVGEIKELVDHDKF